MPVTLENYRDYHLKLFVGNQKVHFFAFNDRPLDETRARIDLFAPHFARLAPIHLLGIAPILLLKDRPLGGHGGGTYPDVTHLHARNAERDAQRAERWGAPIEVMEEIVAHYGRVGAASGTIHVIPLQDWNESGRATTVLHECAHGIDARFTLHRRASSSDPLAAGGNFRADDFPAHLPGQHCGHGTELNRRVVNAFVSMVTGFPSVHNVLTKQQIVARFRESHAFNGVTESWWRTTYPGLV